MREIVVPKLNNNDTTYTLVEWLFQDGETVPEGEPVAVIETSKAAQDLVTPAGGVLHRTAEVRSDCRVGAVIGLVFASEQDRLGYLSSDSARQRDSGPLEDDIVVTEPARALIQLYGIHHDQLLALGRKVIKRGDVEELVRSGARAETPTGMILTLPRRQRAVAEVVARSHAAVPSAFSLVKVRATAVLEARRRFAADNGRVLGLPEVVVKAIAAQRERYPVFFGSYQDDCTVLVPRGAQVGVTVDAGKGLYVPVIRDAEAQPVMRIGELLREFHTKAANESFREQDLGPSNIGLSLNMYTDVVLTHPIVLPGNTCMLSLSGMLQELVLHKSGQVRVRAFFHLGVAYDHRAINGRDVMTLARDLRAALESAERLDALLS